MNDYTIAMRLEVLKLSGGDTGVAQRLWHWLVADYEPDRASAASNCMQSAGSDDGVNAH